MICFLFVLLGATLASAANSPTYVHRLPSGCDIFNCIYFLRVTGVEVAPGQEPRLFFELGAADDWVGVGFSRTKGMPGAHAIVCFMAGAVPVVEEVDAVDYAGATLSSDQSILSDATAEERNGFRFFTFTRAAVGNGVDLGEHMFLVLDLLGLNAPQPGQPFEGQHQHTFNVINSKVPVCLGCGYLPTTTTVTTKWVQPTPPPCRVLLYMIMFYYTGCSMLDLPNGQSLRVFWAPSADRKTLDMALQGDNLGGNWMGLAFPVMPGDMVPADAVIIQPGDKWHEFSLTSHLPAGIVKQPPGTLVRDLVSEVFAETGTTTVRFKRDLRPTDNVELLPIIWAVGVWDTVLNVPSQHAFDGKSAGTINTSHTNVVFSPNMARERQLYAHGALMGLSWGLLLPLGVAIARYGKEAGIFWLTLHRGLQCVALGLIVVALGLSFSVASHSHYAHMYIGLLVIAGGVLVGLLGFVRPSLKAIRRPRWRLAHVWGARAVMLGGVINAFNGFSLLHSAKYGEVAFGISLFCFVSMAVIMERRRFTSRKGAYAVAPATPGRPRGGGEVFGSALLEDDDDDNVDGDRDELMLGSDRRGAYSAKEK